MVQIEHSKPMKNFCFSHTKLRVKLKLACIHPEHKQPSFSVSLQLSHSHTALLVMMLHLLQPFSAVYCRGCLPNSLLVLSPKITPLCQKHLVFYGKMMNQGKITSTPKTVENQGMSWPSNDWRWRGLVQLLSKAGSTGGKQ